jgi:ectoine hydroxylase-related dioxygenase (phytanoyl-CoA dioxygenase family)
MLEKATGRLLTAEELAFFHAEGYVVADGLLPAEELEPVIAEISEEIDRRARALHAEGKLSSLYEEEGFETRLTRISGETDQIALEIWNGSLHGPAVFDLIRNPNLVNAAEQLVGEEIIASSVYRLRPKIPSYGYGEVPWHQDSGYFEPYCDESLVVTMWLPLVDSTEENGCLWVMPRSHLGPVVRHRIHPSSKYLQIEPSEFPRTGRRVCCPVRKGGVLLLTNRTAHASFENRTDVVRWSMDLRYQNASLPTNAEVSRLAGDVVPDPENGIPVACYPPEADFLVRSRLRPKEVVTDPARFAEIRERYVRQPVSDRFGLRTPRPVTAG